MQSQASAAAAVAYGIGDQLVHGQDEVIEIVTGETGVHTVPPQSVSHRGDLGEGERRRHQIRSCTGRNTQLSCGIACHGCTPRVMGRPYPTRCAVKPNFIQRGARLAGMHPGTDRSLWLARRLGPAHRRRRRLLPATAMNGAAHRPRDQPRRGREPRVVRLRRGPRPHRSVLADRRVGLVRRRRIRLLPGCHVPGLSRSPAGG